MEAIILGGGGYYGGRAYWPLTKMNINVVAYIDMNEAKAGDNIYGVKIYKPEEGLKIKHDKVLVAVDEPNAFNSIVNIIKKVRGEEGEIIDIVSDYRWFEFLNDRRIDFLKDFAKYINAYFSDKKLYLFDMFSGFAEEDISDEIEYGDEKFINSRFNNVHEFENTSIEHVMKKMKYTQNVVFKKGYFPDSAREIDNIFFFVILDMDLYLPTLGGLRFFWSRLNEGGYILCHDYFANCLGSSSVLSNSMKKKLA